MIVALCLLNLTQKQKIMINHKDINASVDAEPSDFHLDIINLITKNTSERDGIIFGHVSDEIEENKNSPNKHAKAFIFAGGNGRKLSVAMEALLDKDERVRMILYTTFLRHLRDNDTNEEVQYIIKSIADIYEMNYKKDYSNEEIKGLLNIDLIEGENDDQYQTRCRIKGNKALLVKGIIGVMKADPALHDLFHEIVRQLTIEKLNDMKENGHK